MVRGRVVGARRHHLLLELRFPASWPDPAEWARSGLARVLPRAVSVGEIYEANKRPRPMALPRGEGSRA